MRIGFGYDSHIFESGKPLVLGGVVIPDCDGLKAHSDGDVLIHAIIDALFGAAACGDIGLHFPDTDEQWRGADSTELLRRAVAEVRAAGFDIENIDATVICEKPRLRPHIEAIRQNLADILNLPIATISVKGKTNEGMDDVGAARGILVHAVTLLRPCS